jgi:hypothetical protein
MSGTTASIEDVLKLVASNSPDALRTTHMALKRFSSKFPGKDATYLFNNLATVKTEFMKILGEHSVRHYIGALANAARTPEITSLVFGSEPAAGLAAVEAVLEDCASLSTKVPRRSRRKDSSDDAEGATNDDGIDDEAHSAEQTSAAEASLREENLELRAQLMRLEVQHAGLKERLVDARHVVDRMFEVASKRGV